MMEGLTRRGRGGWTGASHQSASRQSIHDRFKVNKASKDNVKKRLVVEVVKGSSECQSPVLKMHNLFWILFCALYLLFQLLQAHRSIGDR